jgi:imidazolonepropionase-like amidohydrolase
MFDPKSGTNLKNQIVVIKGDRIADVGPADRVPVPADARVIDLSGATVLPGLIDGHVHLTDAVGGLQHQMMVALYSATQSLNAGFTTQVAMGSHGGGYADVELRRAIETGLVRGSPHPAGRTAPRGHGSGERSRPIGVQTVRA